MNKEAILTVVLLGGFAIGPLLSVVAMFPVLRGSPRRWALISAGFIPTALLVFMMITGLLVTGREPKVIAALSPIALAVALPIVSLVSSFLGKNVARKTKLITGVISILLLGCILWASTILWLMTDSHFMGAGC
jgi:hypothetical protein